jgi:hypothetical protein
MNTEKIIWHGKVTSVQPRIRLLRSFDQRQHNYPGYVLRITGTIGSDEREFIIGIGKTAQEKHKFRFGDTLSGQSHPVQDTRIEIAEFYKTSKLNLIERQSVHADPPPWLNVPPDLQAYRARGHRRLDPRTYETKCQNCMWGCKMPVEITIDQWNPQQKKYRVETFCYGPKSCRLYKAGPVRTVPGRKGMVWEEEDRVDEEATAHRSMDD